MNDIIFSTSKAGKTMRPPKHMQARIKSLLPILNQKLRFIGENDVSERDVMLAMMHQGYNEFSRRLKERLDIDL